MIKAFKAWLLTVLQNAIREVECPKCEIAGADDAKVRFGSILTEAEKEWFCFDATKFLRGLGVPL